MRGHALAFAIGLACLSRSSVGATAPPVFVGPDGPLSERDGVALRVDGDDDDDDGQLDLLQASAVPADDLLAVRVQAPPKPPFTIAVSGGVRLVVDGQPVQSGRIDVSVGAPTSNFALQGVRASTQAERAWLQLSSPHQLVRIPIHVFDLRVLDANNRRIDPSRQALRVSLRVTNDASLPRGRAPALTSPDPDNVRIELEDSRITRDRVEVELQSVDPLSQRVRSTLLLPLARFSAAEPLRSRFVRLVADPVDASAAGVSGQVLRVAVRDRVRVRRTADVKAVGQHDLRVGRPGDEASSEAALRLRVRIVVLRGSPAGPPVIGNDELSARDLVRTQLAVSNQIWAQCLVTVGSPAEASVEIVDPPPPTLLSVGDGDGLPAAGDGTIAFAINDRTIGPLATRHGERPVDTALRLKSAVMDAGFYAQVTVNPRTHFGADSSADILVATRDGSLVRIAALPGLPPSTDSRQRLRIGAVDLGDGLDEFDNLTATSGTLEERTLLKALMDDDPTSVDVFVVNRFARGTRQGEAFIEASESPIVNAVILDRNGLSQVTAAHTLAHELGHVLLDEPLHPDNVGPDRPWQLMDSDSSRGTVLGPKRLNRDECDRIRRLSGPEAEPALLTPFDARDARASAPERPSERKP